MLLSIITGHETFGHLGNVKILAFWAADINSDAVPLHEAASDRQTRVLKIGTHEYIVASARNTNHGAWFITRYDVPDNTYLKVLISRHNAGRFVPVTKQFIVRPREGAALHRLRVPFTGSPDASMSCGYIEGRFDLLTFEQLVTQGFNIPRGFGHQFVFDDDENERDEFFTDEIVEPEGRPLVLPSVQTVKTDSGRERKILRTKSSRRVKLGKER